MRPMFLLSASAMSSSSTEPGIHCAVVGNVIAIVTLGAGEEGSDPQQFHTQLLQVVQLGGNALQIAFAVSVGVAKAFEVDLIHNFVLKISHEKSPLIRVSGKNRSLSRNLF
jgi:hypothetical protein